MILQTTQSSSVYAVGPVSVDHQQDFNAQTNVTYLNDRAAAVAAAKALVASGRRIFLLNIDTGKWSEISR